MKVDKSEIRLGVIGGAVGAGIGVAVKHFGHKTNNKAIIIGTLIGAVSGFMISRGFNRALSGTGFWY